MAKKIAVLAASLICALSFAGCGSHEDPAIAARIPRGAPPEVRKQIFRLQSAGPRQRLRAVESLGQMGTKADAAVPFLIPLLGDKSEVKDRGCQIMQLLPVPRSSCAQIVAYGASDALVHIRYASFAPLLNVTAGADPFARRNAVIALQLLIQGGMHDTRALEPLVRTLRDADTMTRVWSARGLGDLGDPRAVEPLIEALRDDDFDVRGEAASALAKLQDKRAIEPLVQMLEERRQNSGFAARALRDLTGQPESPDPQVWREWWNKNKQPEAPSPKGR